MKRSRSSHVSLRLCASVRRTGVVILAALTCLPLSYQVNAKEPQVRIVAESDLRFGTFMVFGSGSRTVSANGMVTDSSLVALEGNPTGPARFSLSYDRGNQSKHVIDIEVELVVSPGSTVQQQGVRGSLSAFQTDLPGVGSISPGQPIRVLLRNCRERVCSQSFTIGARLDVSRQFGGANLIIPIPVDVAIISVQRQGG